jgi:hypothetical protein
MLTEEMGELIMSEPKKKVASFKPVEKPVEKSIWDYKPHMIIGIIILAGILIFFAIRSGMADRAREKAKAEAAAPVATKDPNAGTLKVETQPFGAVVQLLDKMARTPATMENITAGEYFVIIRHPKYKTMQKTVVIKPGEVTELKVDLEHP